MWLYVYDANAGAFTQHWLDGSCKLVWLVIYLAARWLKSLLCEMLYLRYANIYEIQGILKKLQNLFFNAFIDPQTTRDFAKQWYRFLVWKQNVYFRKLTKAVLEPLLLQDILDTEKIPLLRHPFILYIWCTSVHLMSQCIHIRLLIHQDFLFS